MNGNYPSTRPVCKKAFNPWLVLAGVLAFLGLALLPCLVRGAKAAGPQLRVCFKIDPSGKQDTARVAMYFDGVQVDDDLGIGTDVNGLRCAYRPIPPTLQPGVSVQVTLRALNSLLQESPDSNALTLRLPLVTGAPTLNNVTVLP